MKLEQHPLLLRSDLTIPFLVDIQDLSMTIKAGKSTNRILILLVWSCEVLITDLTLIVLILKIVNGRSEREYAESFILA